MSFFGNLNVTTSAVEAGGKGVVGWVPSPQKSPGKKPPFEALSASSAGATLRYLDLRGLAAAPPYGDGKSVTRPGFQFWMMFFFFGIGLDFDIFFLETFGMDVASL